MVLREHALSLPNNLSGPQWFLPLSLVLFIGSGCSVLINKFVRLSSFQLEIGLSALSLGVLLGTFMGDTIVSNV